ncbi:MAG: carbamoyltransferase [Planctomycetaceae bacterium]
MTSILGLSAFYHDSAACLVVDGEIVAAAQEERFSRKKHDERFPKLAVEYCLSAAGLTPSQLDYVAFYDKPLLKFDRLLETYLGYAPSGFGSFVKAMPVWLKDKLYLPRAMRKELPGYEKRFVFTEHHESHAASAFYPSPFERAAVLTVDGVGEWATASIGIGEGNQLRLTHEMHFPHSPGLLYSAFTYFCGFKVNSGEYKLMGLAPYGEPKYADLIREKLIDLKEDGSFRMDLSYFNYCQGLTMTSKKFDQLFGGPPRQPETPLTQREMDLAASIQVVTEEILLRMSRHVQALTGLKQLCLAGGVALNCVANGRILREGPFEDLWIQPAAGDAGGALGAALFVWHQLLDKPRPCNPKRERGTGANDSLADASGYMGDSQHGSLLGPCCDEADIRAFLDAKGAKYRFIEDETELCNHVANLIATEHVVGWVQGRMEFGPRALGSRSILGDARSPQMQSAMNVRIKFRESFRPFAPSVLEERVAEYFETRPHEPSPYMLLVANVRESKRTQRPANAPKLTGIDKLKELRSCIPAVTHVDNSARIQTVDAERHGRYYRLLKAFEAQTGSPVVINTSFNVRGEPIVLNHEHAYRCFLATNMDVLVLERFVLLKKDQPNATEQTLETYLKEFVLD